MTQSPSQPDQTTDRTTVPDSGIPDANMLRRRVLSLPTLIAITVGASLLGFALWGIFDFEWPEVWNNIKSVHLGKYLLAFILYYISFWFRGLRWRLIAKTADIGGNRGKNVPTTTALSGIILIGWFANSVAFMRLGDAYRGWALSRESRSDFPSSLGTVIAERVQDMAAILILILIAVTLISIEGESTVPGWVVFFAFAMVGSLTLGLLIMRVAGERLSRLLPGRLASLYKDFQRGTLGSFSSRRIPFQIALGIVSWLLEIGRFYFVADALSVEVSFGIVMFAALANSMLTTIPTPGGFGFVEGGVTGLLILFGLNHSDSISLVAVDRTISWLSVVLFGGALFVIWHTVRTKSSTEDSRSANR